MDVLTLVHGREDHLANQIAGLERSTVLPDRLIVVQMNQTLRSWSSQHFPIINCAMTSSDGRLPLARARNLAAKSAQSDHLVFLDVDCIPSTTLLASYRKALSSKAEKIFQGLVKYLPPMSITDCSETQLDERAVAHDAFAAFSPGDTLPHYLFWSLNFACTQDTFERVGGFDERYAGYGGEDTDFAYRAQRGNRELSLVNAKAFHQYHPTYSPPLNHLSDIVRNAQLFREQWGWWPMKDWLVAFRRAGYVEFNEDDFLAIKRLPTQNEIAAARTAP